MYLAGLPLLLIKINRALTPYNFLLFATFHDMCFVHPIFRFWLLVTFGDKVTKILHNLCLHFVRQDGQDGKKSEMISFEQHFSFTFYHAKKVASAKNFRREPRECILLKNN